MKSKIKRSQLPELLEQMRSLKGIATVKKAIEFGRDIKYLKNLIDEANEAIEKIKTERYVELEKEIQKKFGKELRERGSIQNSELKSKWNNADEFIELYSDFTFRRDQYLNEICELDFCTIFSDNDLTSLSDGKTAEMLANYFMA